MEPTEKQIQQAAAVLGVEPAQIVTLPSAAEQAEHARIVDEIDAKRAAAQAVVAAQQAVEDGEMTPGEVAQALLASGDRRAHDVFVADWLKEETESQEFDDFDDLALADAEDYVAAVNARDAFERARLEEDAAALARKLEVAQVEGIRDRFSEVMESTPGAHRFAPEVEKRLIEKIQRDGTLPSTEAERDALIEAAINETLVLGSATESIAQQVEMEWRLLRKSNGGRDGLNTAADIAAAEAHYKAARFKQLADSRMIDTSAFEPAPTAEEESKALAERYQANERRSTAYQQQVADIAAAGRDAKAGTVDRGLVMTADRDRYKAALARAEASAAYGDAGIRSGYGANAVAADNKDQRQLDEFGGAFPGYEVGG